MKATATMEKSGPMGRWILWLGGILVLQIALAVALHQGSERYQAFEPSEPLLVFDQGSLDGLRIEDGDGTLLIERREGRWVLPEQNAYPASAGKVRQLLERLAGLKKGWPVATTAGAATRFKVAKENFERRLVLLRDGKPVATLYVGSSPGFRKAYVRPEGDEAVYAVEFNTWEVTARPLDWADRRLLALKKDELQRVAFPGVTLVRQGDAWQPEDLAEDEQPDTGAIDSLLGRLAALQAEPLFKAPEKRPEQPEFSLEVTRKGGEKLVYRFFKPEDGGYLVRRSDLDTWFRLSASTAEPLKEAERKSLVSAKEEKKEPAPGDS